MPLPPAIKSSVSYAAGLRRQPSTSASTPYGPLDEHGDAFALARRRQQRAAQVVREAAVRAHEGDEPAFRVGVGIVVVVVDFGVQDFADAGVT